MDDNYRLKSDSKIAGLSNNLIDHRNILMCGPVMPPVHGQSLNFTLIAKRYLCNEKYIIDQNFKTRGIGEKVLTTLRIVIKYLYFFSVKKIDLVYFSSSRSLGGCIKDICLINIASLFKIKLINHIHGADFNNLLNTAPSFMKKIIKNGYNKVHTTIVLIDTMKTPFLQFKLMNLKVLPNFYDPVLDEFDNYLRFKRDDPLEILYFSNIMKTKGIIELIDAFIECKTNKNVRLNIAGEFIGDDECNLAEIKRIFFDKINGAENIIYHGVLRGEEKSRLFYNSSIFALPSYYISEAFPISIVEAMRAGCAIITTKHNYLGDIIKPVNGMLVDTRNIAALTNALEYLISNTELLKKIQQHNILEAKNRYSLAACLNTLKHIFDI
jgi:glycosyltransferase involved in cell wall biosynthesis